LCVDDEASILKSLVRVFMDSSYEIITADSGEEGLKVLEKTPLIQVVMSDYRMPGMNGLEAARQIREFNNKVPIIAQTANALKGDKELALEAGCSDYISKPVESTELLRIVNQFTGRRNGTVSRRNF
jgi:CheY-like chemotaxis protein